MSIERARQHLRRWNKDVLIQEHEVSSATVELAAEALHTVPGRIAKTLSFLNGERTLLIVAAGDAKVDTKQFKNAFGVKKARMVPAEEVEERTGHAVGGVCPFGVNEGVDVFLDVSLKRWPTVFPACGSSNS
ncbi:YbaK/EbsC family protein, partial [uncultured Mailhella sp.]|uniref:YbaK/EbsC family protein n=1 Tax=uncultured Mailhella sp. TaxID=1981031 RepID=UPI00261E5113